VTEVKQRALSSARCAGIATNNMPTDISMLAPCVGRKRTGAMRATCNSRLKSCCALHEARALTMPPLHCWHAACEQLGKG